MIDIEPPLQVPGGNTSYANACAKQFDVPGSVFGEKNEGVSSRDDCDNLPKNLREGCRWQFDWFKNADRPEYVLILPSLLFLDIHQIGIIDIKLSSKRE